MSVTAAARRLGAFVLATAAWLLVLEGVVRVSRLETRLPKAPGGTLRFQPVLADSAGGKRLEEYTRPPVRDGLPLTRVEKITEPDPELLWRLKPSSIWERQGWVVMTNALGFRDPEVPEPKPAGEIRILCLGDSITFGWGLDEPDRWTSLLQASLRAGGQSVRVVNAAVYGYSSTQGRMLLEGRRLLDLGPDVAILTFGVNDATGGGRALTDMLARPRANRGKGPLHHLALYRCLVRGLVPLRDRLLMDRADRMNAGIFRHNLERMTALLRDRGVAPVVVGEVVTAGVGEDRLGRLPELGAIAREVAAAEGVPFVDLPAVFAKLIPVRGVPAAGTGDPAGYFMDATHPNRRGSEVIAAEVARALAAAELLTSPSRTDAGGPP